MYYLSFPLFPLLSYLFSTQNIENGENMPMINDATLIEDLKYFYKYYNTESTQTWTPINDLTGL